MVLYDSTSPSDNTVLSNRNMLYNRTVISKSTVLYADILNVSTITTSGCVIFF